MASLLGTIVGQIKIDISQASAAYAAIRAQHAQTLYALEGSAAGFKKSGVAMAAVGTGMVAVFAKAVSSAAEFEKRMDFFGAVTATSAKDMDLVREKAIQLGQDTRYSANEIADSFVELGKAGVSANDIIDGVGQAVANLGASADIPLANAANIITSQIQAFGLHASDAVHVANQLQGAANASIAEVEDLGVSLKYVGGVAAAVHVPFESTVDAISLLAKAGIRGSTAGTSLRQMLVSLQGNSDKARAELSKLGIITKQGGNLFVDAAGHIKPLDQVFQILQDHTKGLTEAQRLMAFKVIFNNRALAAAAILTKSGTKGFAAMHAEIAKTTAADVAAKRMDNLSGDIEILRGNIETLLIKGGTPFQGFLRGIVQGATQLLQVFGSLPDGVQTGIFAFLGVGGALLILMGIFNMAVGTILTFGATLIRMGAAFNFLKNIVVGMRTAMFALNAAFLTNPIFLIVAAIALLVVGFILLYKHSQTFRNAIADIGQFFVAVWNGVLSFFQGVPGFFSSMWGKITGFFTTALDAIKNNWQTILGIIMGPLGLILFNIGGFRDKIVGFFKSLWDNVSTATVNGVKAVGAFFATLPERVAYWLGFLVGRAIRIWLSMWILIGQASITGFNAVVSFFTQLPGRIAAFFVAAKNLAVNAFVQLKNGTVNLARAVVASVIANIVALPGRLAALFTSAKNRAVSIFNQAKTLVVNAARATVSGVSSFIAQLPGRVAAFFSAARSRAVSIFSSMKSGVVSAAHAIVSGIGGAIGAIPGLISGVFHRALAALGGFAGAAFNRAKSIGSSLWDGFKNGLGINSPSYIEKAMFAITATMDSETKKTAAKVGILQNMGRKLATDNPVSAYGAALQAGLPTAMPASLSKASVAVAGPAIASRVPRQRGSAEGTAQGAPGSGQVMNVTINNPKAEPASDSLYRTHQKLIYLGLDGGA